MGAEGVEYRVCDEGRKTVRVVKEEIHSKHSKFFSELGVLPDIFKISLNDDAVPLCLCVPMRVPIRLREAKAHNHPPYLERKADPQNFN